MIYQFSCPTCGKYDEVVRTVDECQLPNMCPDCSQPMNRIYSVPQVNVPHTSSYYDNGLGCKISNEGDKRDALKRIENETGQKLVEIGTEDPRKHVKPPKIDYDIPRGLFDNAIQE
jgi:putative FmdB family regulatory protein